MAVRLEATIQRWIGLSTDTKPTGPPVGSTFYEANTGYSFKYNGYAWLPVDIMADGLTVNYKQIDLDQVAGDYTVMTATAQDLFIDAVIVHVPDDLSGVGGFDSIAVATDDVAAIEILSEVTGAAQVIELTIAGGSAGAGTVADITVMWRPVVAGGYYLNA